MPSPDKFSQGWQCQRHIDDEVCHEVVQIEAVVELVGQLADWLQEIALIG